MPVYAPPARPAQGKTASLSPNKSNRLSSEPPAQGEIFRVTPQFIDRREIFDQEDGGGSIVRLGLSKADQSRIGAARIEVDRNDGDPTLEFHQQFEITVTGSRVEDWSYGYQARIIDGTATIVPFEPNFSTKIDGLPADVCHSLEKRFGPDFALKIAADNGLMSDTRFSLEKQALIIEACVAEKDAAETDTAFTKKIMAMYCACGVAKEKARQLAYRFDKKKSPYQALFQGRLSFKQADRFAHLFNPKRAEQDRPLAIVIAQFLDTESVVVSKKEIDVQAQKNFSVGPFKTTAALEKLMHLGVIREDNDLFGLTRLIEAEQSIAGFLATNHRVELPADVEAVIQHVLDNANDFLGREVVLDVEQREAIWQVFRYPFTVITGGPGTGKTLICALINVIACMLYHDREPAVGMALAGTAASNLREATICKWKSRVIALPASTIHKALKMEPTDDDVYDPGNLIVCGVLILDEPSMISSSLLEAILKSTQAHHVVFVGDADQLQPIGSGKPFRDIIASRKIPVTYLTKNHRTECAGIRGLCENIIAKNLSPGTVSEHETQGGFVFQPCEHSAKPFLAASLYADFVTKYDFHDVAILTPFNQGDGGTRSINQEVRKALGFPDRLVEGDLLLVTKNNYKAIRPDEPNPKKPELFITIYNGERCYVTQVGLDFADVEFVPDAFGYIRRVRFLTTKGGGLPPGFQFGYAFSVHKAQSKQFPVVIVVSERSSKAFGIVQCSSVYTACSRARDHLVVLGDLLEFVEASKTPEIRRSTLLLELLTGKSYKSPAIIEVGARVAWFTKKRDCPEGSFLEGGILSVENVVCNGLAEELAVIKFDDGSRERVFTSYLKTPVVRELPGAANG